MIDLATLAPLHVTRTHDDRVWELRLDHGKANEVGSAVLRAFERLVRALHDDGRVAALVTWSDRASSKGTPLFVAGADVTERVGWDEARVKDHVRWQRRVLRDLRHAPVFHVCVVGGVAFGWGTEYLLTADFRIATDGARFALPETGLGIVPGAGGSAELAAEIGRAHTLRLGMTGEAIGAAEALRIGLVQERHPTASEGLERARTLALKAATRSPTANAAFKGVVLGAPGHAEAERTTLEARAYAHCVDTGEAGRGREAFAAIRRGEVPDWAERKPLEDPDDA